jgi:hypothetical protein
MLRKVLGACPTFCPPFPHPWSRARSRCWLHAQLAVVGNTLWLFGGTVEVGSREITLDDVWRLDLAKLDGWVLVRGNSAGDELFKAEGDESSEWEEGSEGDEA